MSRGLKRRLSYGAGDNKEDMKKLTEQATSAKFNPSSSDSHPARTDNEHDYDAEPIWNLPTLQKDQFFAAAHYLSYFQRAQQRPTRKFNKQNYPGLKAIDIEKGLLDGIALLFARFKPLKDKSGPDGRAMSTAQHVTAVAMRKTIEGLTVYIAKNDGPRAIDGIDDETFANQLSSWFNNKSDDSLRQRMHDFWKHRRRYYWQEMPKIWKKINASSAGQCDLVRHYRNHGINEDEFLADWDDVKSIMLSWEPLFYSLDDLDSDGPGELGRQSYPRFSLETRDEASDLANHFRKLVKCIKLHGTISRVWKTFVRFRDHVKGSPVRFEFLRGRGNFPLDKDSVIAAINSWNGVHDEVEGLSAFELEKAGVVEKIRKQKKISRYFHCELQLLERFIAADDVLDYFGCSKLSCFMCWGILECSRYRTKDTHAKVYPACAFPFTIFAGRAHFELALALKTIQDRLMLQVLRRATDPDHALTQHDLSSETNPHEVLSGMEIDEDLQELKVLDPRLVPPLLQQPSLPKLRRTQAIKIPQNGKPRLEIVTLRNNFDDSQGMKLYIPIARYRVREESWVSDVQPSIRRRRWRKLFLKPSELSDIERWTIGLNIWFFSSSHNDQGELLPCNKWCLNIIRRNMDPIDTLFPWRGDLYLFANADVGQVEEIPEDIHEHDFEAVQQSFIRQFCQGWHFYKQHSRTS